MDAGSDAEVRCLQAAMQNSNMNLILRHLCTWRQCSGIKSHQCQFFGVVGWLTLVLDFWHCHSLIAGYFCFQEHDGFSPSTGLTFRCPDETTAVDVHPAACSHLYEGKKPSRRSDQLVLWRANLNAQRSSETVVCRLWRASSCVLANPKRTCLHFEVHIHTWATLHGHITNKINKKQNKKKIFFSFSLVCVGPCCSQWFPITVGDPVSTHNPPSLVSSSEISVLYQLAFSIPVSVQLCFLQREALHCWLLCSCASEDLHWAPAICQTHTHWWWWWEPVCGVAVKEKKWGWIVYPVGVARQNFLYF